MTDAADSYDLHDSLGYQITLLARITERRFEQALTPLGLSRVTWCVLLALGQQGLDSPSAIAGYIGIDRTATSRALRRLERDGCISRKGGTQDRRMTEVSITSLGRQKLAAATEAAQGNAHYFSQKLSWYERDSLKTIIATLMEGEARNVSGL